MAADPLIYCLQEVTDYEQFERFCSDLMALDGFANIEPLGGSKDKGRDAIRVDRSVNGETTVFAYSVREDWRNKLQQDSTKIHQHGHTCDRLVFLCTAPFTATERDEAIAFVVDAFGWPLELYGLERLAVMLRTTHQQVVAKHPQIFVPPFFPTVGGLSTSLSFDHVIIDHDDADTALAHWLSRRLSLAGYFVWCRGLAPLAGSSVSETIRVLLATRANRFVPILSVTAVGSKDFAERLLTGHLESARRSSSIVLPALATKLSADDMKDRVKGLACADFTDSWANGLKQVEAALAATNCPRKPEGARELVLQSYFSQNVLVAEPEQVASNLFKVIAFPNVIHRFISKTPWTVRDNSFEAGWAFRKVSDQQFLAFFDPPDELTQKYGFTRKGGAFWNVSKEIDGISVYDILKELIRKALYVECLRLGLKHCKEKNTVFFPEGLFKNEFLRLYTLSGSSRMFAVVGERTFGRGDRATKYRHAVMPVFAPMGSPDKGYEIIVRIRVRITDLSGRYFPGDGGNRRRKKLCKTWWNDDWLLRTMGVMQFLAERSENITIGTQFGQQLIIDATPHTWMSPVRLDEAALAEVPDVTELELKRLSDPEEDEDDSSEDDAALGT